MDRIGEVWALVEVFNEFSYSIFCKFGVKFVIEKPFLKGMIDVEFVESKSFEYGACHGEDAGKIWGAESFCSVRSC